LFVLVVCGVGVGIFLADQTHHVVARVVRANDPASRAGTQTQGEYPAAPGASSLKSVQAALAAVQNEHQGEANAPVDLPGSLLTSDAAASFDRLRSSMSGRLGLAVTPLGAGRTEILGEDEAAHGWSTTKVPVLVALLKARGSKGLTAQEQQWARAAITASDNRSILDLFGDLERIEGGLGRASKYVQNVLRLSGDSDTVVPTAPPPAGAVTTFGQTEWSPANSVKFFRALALGCLLSSSETSYVLRLMESIEPSESWGLGSAGFGSVAFKGGWGPESGGYLVRQSGIVNPRSSSGVTVAIVAFAPSFSAGTEMLTRTASWLAHHLALTPRPRASCGG